MVKTKKGWTRSDSLAVALACLAGAMAIAFLWMEKTPGWALFTVIALVVLVVYPICHFCSHWKFRILCLAIVWAGIGLFGWYIWPHAAMLAGPSPQAQQKSRTGKSPQNAEATSQTPVTKQWQSKNPATARGGARIPKQQKCETGSICNQYTSVQSPQTINNYGDRSAAIKVLILDQNLPETSGLFTSRFQLDIQTVHPILLHVKATGNFIKEIGIDDIRPPGQGGKAFMGTTISGKGFYEEDFQNVETGSYYIYVRSNAAEEVTLACY